MLEFFLRSRKPVGTQLARGMYFKVCQRSFLYMLPDIEYIYHHQTNLGTYCSYFVYRLSFAAYRLSLIVHRSRLPTLPSLHTYMYVIEICLVDFTRSPEMGAINARSVVLKWVHNCPTSPT
jgi:hypothetical protein